MCEVFLQVKTLEFLTFEETREGVRLNSIAALVLKSLAESVNEVLVLEHNRILKKHTHTHTQQNK